MGKAGGFSKDLGAAGASQVPNFAPKAAKNIPKPPFLPKKNPKKTGIPSPRNVRLATGSLCLSRFSRLGSWEALWSRQRSMAGIGKAGIGKAGIGIRDPLPHPIPTPFSRPGPSRHGNAPGAAGKKPGSWEGELGLGGEMGEAGVGNKSLGFRDAAKSRDGQTPGSRECCNSQGWEVRTSGFGNAGNAKDPPNTGIWECCECQGSGINRWDSGIPQFPGMGEEILGSQECWKPQG